MILDNIKKANIQALKDKNTSLRSLYSVFLTKIKLLEISKRESGEQITEVEVIATIQKMLKELEEEKINYEKVGHHDNVSELTNQINTLSNFLPLMMSEKEIYDIISNMPDRSIPTVMRKFKSDFAGKCDMRLVGEVLKKFN